MEPTDPGTDVRASALSGKTLKAKLGQSRPDGAGLPAEVLAEGVKVPFPLLVEGKEAGVVLG
ncbi:hypothetical protein [Streptomyces sp. ODS05-4]|uniref:hypothetical protein n=1 Tax=Streptomyces sp. ODS05-4 TaxID=2944939 RepID=UPI00210C6AF7|nr:hypothetical protein [Streptomyces sp. ODS05-4]